VSAQVRNARVRRTVTAAAAVALTAGALFSVSACGAGQIAQTSSQVPAVNGAEANTGPNNVIALRDVSIKYADPLPSDGAELQFLISNQSPTKSFKLSSITSEDGTKAKIGGSTTIAPDGFLTGTEPVGTLKDDQNPVARLTVNLPISGQLRPGLTTKLTFAFDDGSTVTFPVPVDAGATAAAHSSAANH
jgi:hypothetical protein